MYIITPAMKAKIHPKVNTTAKVTCTCGESFITTSTLDDINVEVCSKCHPFYTGVDKFVDTEGIVDKFQKKQQIAQQKIKQLKEVQERKSKVEERASTSSGLTLKDLLKQAKK